MTEPSEVADGHGGERIDPDGTDLAVDQNPELTAKRWDDARAAGEDLPRDG